MVEKTNPYIAGAPVVEKSMFFGREGVFRWIENSLTGKYVDHILVLHGQRRVGKTSVLKHIPNRLPDKYIPIFIDLQGRVSTSLGRFLGWLAREISRALQAEGIDIPRPNRKAFEEDPDFFESTFLPNVKQLLKDRTLLLTFDEFDTFESTDAQESLAVPFMAILKRLMDHEYLSFVFSIGSSGRKLENMQAAYTSFFKQALYRKISFLEPNDAHDLIVKPVASVVEYAPDAVERIIEVTSAHPYFIQLVCHELFSESQKKDTWSVSKEDVDAVLEPVVERGTVNLKFVWDEASELEKWILASLAAADKTLSMAEIETALTREQVRFTRQQLERALLHLREKDVLFEDNRFVIHLLKMWLERNRPMEQVREELEEVNPIVSRLLEIGQEYHDNGEYERAIESFQEALNTEDENLEAHLWLGNSQLARGDYGKAIAEFETVLEIKIDDVSAQKGFCDAYLAMGDESKAEGKLEEAEYAYQQVLGINPQHQEALHRMAELHHRRAVVAITGSQETALQELETALEYAEDEALKTAYQELKAFIAGECKLDDLLLAWGQKAQEMELWDEAQDLLDAYRRESGDEQTVSTAIEEIRTQITQQRQDTLSQRANRLSRLGRYDEAIETWQRYLPIAPEQGEEVQAKIAELQAQAKATAEKQKGFSPMARNLVIAIVVILIAVIGILLAQPTSPLMVALAEPTSTPTHTLTPTPPPKPTDIPPTPTTEPTTTPTLAPTAIPLKWSRISSASFIQHDEVTQVVFDPNDPDVYYAGTANSGLYKTINGGITWEPIQIGMEGNKINSLIIHPTDSNILYAGILDDGVYKTSDGGATWKKMSSKLSSQGIWQFTSEITLDPNNPDTLYYSNGFSIYYSEDAGESWQKYVSGSGEPIAELSVSPEGVVYFTGPWRAETVSRVNPETKKIEPFEFFACDEFSCGDYDDVVSFNENTGTIFVGRKRYDGLFYSTDNGENWQSANVECSYAVFDGKGNAVCTGNRLYFSSNGGLNWTRLDPPESFEIITSAISPHAPDTILVGGRNGIYKSIDQGQTWQDISSGIGSTRTKLSLDLINQTMYIQPNSVYSDSGNIYAAALGNRDFEVFWQVPQRVYVYSYLGANGDWYHFYTQDNSAAILFTKNNNTFQDLPIEMDPDEMHPLHTAGGYVVDGKEYLFVVASGSRLYISEDDGSTWEETIYTFPSSEDGLWGLIPDPAESGNFYNHNTELSYSTDGGQTWKKCGSLSFWDNVGTWPPNDHDVISPDPRYPGHVFYASSSEGLIASYSSDCTTMEKIPQSSGLTNPFIQTVTRNPGNPDTIYVGTANGFYISYNNGETWGEVNDGLLGAQTIYSLAVDPNNPGILYAATPYGIFKLEDN